MKRDSLVQVWVRRTDLATALRYLEGQQFNVRFLSEIPTIIFEDTIELLIRKGMVSPVESVELADKMLERFKKQLNPQGRGRRNFLENLRDEVSESERPVRNEELEGSKDESVELAEALRKIKESLTK